MNLEEHNELAARAVSDEAAFTELYRLYIDQIFRFVACRVRHQETCEDLVADIFRKVFLALERFDPKKACFRTWIYSVANHTLIDHYRTNSNPAKSKIVDIEEVYDLASNDDSPHELVLSSEQKEFVQSQISHLPEKYQQIIQLKYFADYSNPEIAEVMKLSVNNVRVLLFRALKKLKPLISE